MALTPVEWQQRHRAKHPEKARARTRVNKMIQRGTLKRPSRCPRCGKKRKTQAHHPNYANPTEIVFLCRPCHLAEHDGSSFQPGNIPAEELIRTFW